MIKRMDMGYMMERKGKFIKVFLRKGNKME